jgi:acyl-CoA hydrolase
MEDMYSYTREKVVEGTFTFVAVDDNKKPTPII